MFYDPLGILSPVVFTAKRILQDLCQKGLGWDDSIPALVAQEWTDDPQSRVDYSSGRSVSRAGLGPLCESEKLCGKSTIVKKSLWDSGFLIGLGPTAETVLLGLGPTVK